MPGGWPSTRPTTMSELVTIPGGFRVEGFDIIRRESGWRTQAVESDPNFEPVVMHWLTLEIARHYVMSHPSERYRHPTGRRGIEFVSSRQTRLVKALRLAERKHRQETEPTDDERQRDMLGTLDPGIDRVDLTIKRGPSWLRKE